MEERVLKIYESSRLNRSYNHGESYNPKLTMGILSSHIKRGDNCMDMGIDNEFHMKLDLKTSKYTYTLFMLRRGKDYFRFSNTRSYHMYREINRMLTLNAAGFEPMKIKQVIACPIQYKEYTAKLGSIKYIDFI